MPASGGIEEMDGQIVTPEEFYLGLKKKLKKGQVLYETKASGENKGGRAATFSGWEVNGRLRFHIPEQAIPEGVMRYLSEEQIKTVYEVYDPGNLKELGRHIEKLCGFRDIRKSVLRQLIVDHA